MKKISLLSFIVILSACSAKISTASATAGKLTAADAERGAQKFPGYTLIQLEEGKRLNDEHCGRCHRLHTPVSHAEAAWQKIVPRMAKKARLDEQSGELILKYLVTMSGK